MSVFVTADSIDQDVEYSVVSYRKFYYNLYNFILQLSKPGDSTVYYMYITSDGPIYDRLFSGVTTPFSIKKTSISIDSINSVNVIIIVDEHDWKTLV